MDRQKLSMTVAAAFIAVGTVAVEPVQAALIDFNFTTSSGATGSFTLNTSIPVSSEPTIARPSAGSQIPGYAYPNAISDFSLSAPYLNLSNVSADYEVRPALTSEIVGLPPDTRGVLSAVVFPNECSRGTRFRCSIVLSVLYSGNVSELPAVLSDNPNSYSRGLAVDLLDPITGFDLNRDLITNVRVVSRQVPESNSGLSILAFAIGGVGLLLKHNSDRKEMPCNPVSIEG